MERFTSKQVINAYASIGVTDNRLKYAERIGALPTPEKIGFIKVYTIDEVAAIVEYFRANPYTHTRPKKGK